MRDEIISFLFPLHLRFRDYVDRCHALMESLRAAGFVTGIYYRGGTSEKDALSRPFDLRTVEGLLAAFEKEGKNYEVDPVFLMGFWAPEFSGNSIRFLNNTVPSRRWLSFEIEMEGPDEETRKRLRDWAAGLALSGRFDGLVVDLEIDTESQLVRSIHWQGQAVDLSGLSVEARKELYLGYIRRLWAPA